MHQTFRLIIDCPDQVGLVARVSQFLADHDASILEASHHTDVQTGRFFMRHEISTDSLTLSYDRFIEEFTPLANEFQMQWKVTDSAKRQRVALLSSVESHCLVDILHRWHTGELHCDIPCIIGNHPQMKQFADWYKVPFHWVDFKTLGKKTHLNKLKYLLDEYAIDLTVLARFMQILPTICAQNSPAEQLIFITAFCPLLPEPKPYQQAYDRGVKLIGATCHYVTRDLDEGPIIEQSVKRISHSDTAADMVRKGKDCEVNALATGVRNHLEDRVIIHHNKTVVFA